MTYINNKEIQAENQIREFAELKHNLTGHSQDDKLFFVQFDDDMAVGSDGLIYQIVDKDAVENEENTPKLYYISEIGNVYNYTEEDILFNNEDMAIFEHCKEQAELNMFGDLYHF